MNPFLIVFRAFSTILALVFVWDWVLAPAELRLEDARELEITSHAFYEKSGRTTLMLRSQYGHQQKVSCDRDVSFCSTLKRGLPPALRIWQVDLGMLQGPALAAARAGEVELVSLAEQNVGYVDARATIAWIKWCLIALAIVAWRWRSLRQRFLPKQTDGGAGP